MSSITSESVPALGGPLEKLLNTEGLTFSHAAIAAYLLAHRRRRERSAVTRRR